MSISVYKCSQITRPALLSFASHSFLSFFPPKLPVDCSGHPQAHLPSYPFLAHQDAQRWCLLNSGISRYAAARLDICWLLKSKHSAKHGQSHEPCNAASWWSSFDRWDNHQTPKLHGKCHLRGRRLLGLCLQLPDKCSPSTRIWCLLHVAALPAIERISEGAMTPFQFNNLDVNWHAFVNAWS